MYLIGGEHPHKLDARLILERLAGERRRLLTSSEVFQEILHRYASTDRHDRIELGFEALRGIVDDVLAIDELDVLAAKDLVHAHQGLSARDALHVALMRRHQITDILSFERAFDTFAGIQRIPDLA